MGRTKQEEAFEPEISKAIELGRKNQKYIQKALQWCSHFRCQMTTSGMLAPYYDLPIGSHRISCKHSKYTKESVNLPWIVPEFIIQSCQNCSHRKSQDDGSWGQKIIDDYATSQIEEENKKREFEEGINKIRAKIRNIPKKAKLGANINEREFFIFTEELFSDEYSISKKALDYLIQAAKLSPDIFPEIIIDLLISRFTEPLFAKQCMLICFELAHQREDYSNLFYKTSIDAIIKNIGAESAAAIILALNRWSDISTEDEIKSIILVQYRISFHIARENQRQYPNLVILLNKNI